MPYNERMRINNKELVSAYTHLGGAVAAFIGFIFLLAASWGRWEMVVVSTVYAAASIFMFMSSFSYHMAKKEENSTTLWRKMDHLAIFVMIAGSYTVLCHIFLEGWIEAVIIGAQWFLVLCGFFFKFFWIKAPRFLSPLVYVLMGWMIIIPIGTILGAMSNQETWLLVLGGLSYTVGALFYGIKKPNFSQSFTFHELFHVLILLGFAFHWVAVFLGLKA